MKSILAIIVLNLVILVNDITIQNIEYKNCGWLENRLPRCKSDGLFVIYLPNLMYNGVARTGLLTNTNKQTK